MIERKLIPIERLREVLDYDPLTGLFTWKDRGDQFSFQPAFRGVMAHGYLRGRLDGVYYMAHRAAWAYVHGEQPDIIDHINGDKADNRIINLRAANYSSNALNRRVPSNNRTGDIGIFYLAGRPNPWRASVKIRGLRHFQRQFKTREEAIRARNEVWAQHGVLPTHGRSLHYLNTERERRNG